MATSSAQARAARPKLVRPISSQSPAYRTTARPTTMSCEVLTTSVNPGAPPSRCAVEKIGCTQRSSRALKETERFLEKDREAKGRDQRRLRGDLAQRPEHETLGHQTVHRPDRGDHQQHHEQGKRQRADPHQRERGDGDERGVRADHRDLAERQIDPADDRVDQGVADREQAIEAADGDAVEGELQEVQESARPGRCVLGGSDPRRHLRLVQVEPVPTEQKHPDLGQRALAVGDHPDQPQAVVLEPAPAELAGDPMRRPSVGPAAGTPTSRRSRCWVGGAPARPRSQRPEPRSPGSGARRSSAARRRRRRRRQATARPRDRPAWPASPSADASGTRRPVARSASASPRR